MCGIAGLVTGHKASTAEATVGRMSGALLHRGPHSGRSDQVVTKTGVVALGARRLRILDLSGGADQPMTSRDSGVILTFNGEIYNFRDLRDELRKHGYLFETTGDTEVVLRAFEKWGAECFKRLRGMFALAVWDPLTQTVLLARDHLGIKPLYVSYSESQLAWASEVQALKLALNTTTIDQKAVDDFLRYGSVSEPRTIYREIKMLPPGSWIRIDPEGRISEREQFWSLPRPLADTSPVTGESERGRELLTRSIDRHLISDAPLGVLLSSGMDSRTVLGLAVRSQKELHSFTVSFPDNQHRDEGGAAAETARRWGSTHHDIPVPDSEALGWVHEGLASMDQPSLDGLNTYIVTRAIKQHGLVVALSGLGGDELFAGYPSFVQLPRWLRMRRLSSRLPVRPVSLVLEAIASRRSEVTKRKTADLLAAGDDLQALYRASRRVLSQSDMLELGRTESETPLEGSRLGSLASDDVVNAISFCELNFYLRNTLLRDADVFSMANSIELRVPFLDVDLVEWALAMPGHIKVRSGKQKPLLAEMAGDALSEVEGPKKGFALPFESWLSGPLRTSTQDALADLAKTGWFEPQGIQAIWDRYEHEPHSAAWSRVWTLVTLSAWLSRHA